MFLKKLVLKSILFYQKINIFHNPLIKTLFPAVHTCRFTPTCSRYTYLAIEKHGLAKGLWKGLKRILRCHPLNKGGIDYP